MAKNTAKCAAQKNPKQGVMSNHLTTTERYTEKMLQHDTAKYTSWKNTA